MQLIAYDNCVHNYQKRTRIRDIKRLHCDIMSNNRNVRFAPIRFECDIIITMNKRQNIYIHNGGTMTHKWGIIIATAMVVVATQSACLVGGGDDVEPETTLSSATQKQMLMDNAFANGETLFMYDAEQSTQYALYYGNVHIVFLKPNNLRGVKLTSNECINLSVRKKHVDDTGDVTWSSVYSFPNLFPGDYVVFDGSWRVTSYNPANAIATGG